MNVCEGTRVRLSVKSGLFSLKKQPHDQTFGQLPKCAVVEAPSCYQESCNPLALIACCFRDSARIIISLSKVELFLKGQGRDGHEKRASPGLSSYFFVMRKLELGSCNLVHAVGNHCACSIFT